MKIKYLIFTIALTFSFLFSLIYIMLFHSNIPRDEKEKITLYMNQIGLYKQIENANKSKDALEAQGVKTYIYKNQDLYVVVSGIGEKGTAIENGNTLKALSYSHILKELEITDPTILSYVEEENFEKALELIGNQSQGNAQ